ncbi:MAG: hypothetical protein L0H64_22420, partial [Pseudonocardia sp.]|nr:hypothetical protein [Pseudonocardia sp.]
ALRLPLVEPAPDQEGKLRLVLPGSSIAGALRSRAELVCRTLRGTPTPDGFAEQLASTPLVQAVWGAAAGEPGATHSAVEVRDCPSTTTVSATAYLTLLTGDQAPRSVAASGGAQLRVTDHVSVDRWTGGAADGRLFSEVEPHGVTYEPIRLRLRTDRLSPGVRDAATALLLVTLRELVEGRIPLGGATHRGYGTVAVDHIRITGGPEWSGPGLELLDPAFAAQRTAWRTWIDTEDPDGSR